MLIETLDVDVAIVVVANKGNAKGTISSKPCLPTMQERMVLHPTFAFLVEDGMDSFAPSCGLQGTYPAIVRIYAPDVNQDTTNEMQEEGEDTVPNMDNIVVIAHLFRSFVFVSARYKHVETKTYFSVCCNPS